jgi:hypothetical protein
VTYRGTLNALLRSRQSADCDLPLSGLVRSTTEGTALSCTSGLLLLRAAQTTSCSVQDMAIDTGFGELLVLCSMFYVLCSMFYVLCSLFSVLWTRSELREDHEEQDIRRETCSILAGTRYLPGYKSPSIHSAPPSVPGAAVAVVSIPVLELLYVSCCRMIERKIFRCGHFAASSLLDVDASCTVSSYFLEKDSTV